GRASSPDAGAETPSRMAFGVTAGGQGADPPNVGPAPAKGCAAMSPGMGPVRMRSRLQTEGGAADEEEKAGAWDLWKVLPRVRPYLAPYRRTLIVVMLLTVAAAILGLAEPWPLAVILNEVL